jgi:hypothetical protein
MTADPDNQAGCERVAAGGCLICRIPAIRHGKRCGEFPG